MANVTHSTIIDPYIHETKGYEAAEAGTVKMATGSGNQTFNRPLELVYSMPYTGYSSAAPSVDITGLEDYRTLIFVWEGVQGTSGSNLLIQLSADNGSSFLSSGYKSSRIDTDTDALNEQTNGLFTISTNNTDRYGHGITFVSNFNDSGNYTSCFTKYAARNTANIVSSSLASAQEPGSTYGYYATNQAHNAVKVLYSISQSSAQWQFNVWGIRG